MEKDLTLELQERCNSIEDESKRKVITSILNDNDWYKKTSFDTVINLLEDLGYNFEEALDVYKYLILK